MMKMLPLLALVVATLPGMLQAEPSQEMFKLDPRKPAEPAQPANPHADGQANPHAGVAVTDAVMTGELDPQALILQLIPMGRSYLEYQVNDGALAPLKGYDQATEVTVILGTWDLASQQVVPGFIKIEKSLANPNIQARYLGVDEQGQAPELALPQQDVATLPTLVFRRGGEEIGRITGGPEVSLEADLVAILAGQQ